MICGIIISFSFLSEKGLWRKFALGLSIFVGLYYFIAFELMRMVFQGNGILNCLFNEQVHKLRTGAAKWRFFC
ncbi:hypothetical protein B8W99_09670 [Peribacillus simplex]|nr:hypothetical protein B8W99_09670 [Peribacillus simplex]